MKNNKLDINKTKYRYLMDNLSLFPIRPIITYTIPVPNDPTIDESKEEFFDRTYPDVKITNLHFKHMIDKTAKALVVLGVKAGDIVTMCQTNTPEMFYMDYALSKIGARANFIYPNVTAEEMKYYMDELDSKYMFILDDEPIRKNVKKATDGTGIKIISSTPIESFPSIFKMIAAKKMPQQERTVLENEVTWNEFIENGKVIKEVKEHPYIPNEVSYYMHTSGTSSVPKAVMITNENANCTPANYEYDGYKFIKGTNCVQTIPQFVQYGAATNQVIFCNNLCACIIPEMEPKNYYDLIHKFKPHYSFATPSHAKELIKRPTDMSNSTLLGFGGDGFDFIEKKLNKYLFDNGSKIEAYQGYGSTEVSAVAFINLPWSYKEGSFGKPAGMTRAMIVEPGTNNEIKENNVVGEMCITGPGVTLGYVGNSKDENDNVFKKHDDGKIWVHMGDYTLRDDEGFYYYKGRMKNIIKRKSFAFSPDEIVNAILKHPNVLECVVVPRYSYEEGETPSAHISLNDYSDIETTFNEILKLVNDNVQEFHRPTDYKIRSEMLKTRNNKNDLTALKIEDTISMYDNVLDVNISKVSNGEYDYELNIDYNSSNLEISENELISNMNKYLSEIAHIMKYDIGKIKYNINYLKLNYVDGKPYIYEKGKSFVKHI